VLGGLSTKQEMCQIFLMYYPRIDLMQCTSQYEFHDFFHGLKLDEVSGSVLNSIKMPYNPNELPRDQRAFDPADDTKELEESGDGTLYKSMFDQIKIEAPTRWKGTSVGDYLKQANWTDQKFGKEVEANWKNGRHYAYCTGHGRKRVPLKNHIIPFPTVKEPLRKSVSGVCRLQHDVVNGTSRTNPYQTFQSEVSGINSVSIAVKTRTGTLNAFAGLVVVVVLHFQ